MKQMQRCPCLPKNDTCFLFPVTSYTQWVWGQMKWSEVKSLSRVRLFATPCTVAHQAFLSMESPGKNTEVGCYARLQEIFQPRSQTPASCIIGRFFTIWATREAQNTLRWSAIKQVFVYRCRFFLFLIKSRLVYKEILNKTSQGLKY